MSSSVLVKEALDVPGAHVSLVHHRGGPPGVPRLLEDGLGLAAGSSSPDITVGSVSQHLCAHRSILKSDITSV